MGEPSPLVITGVTVIDGAGGPPLADMAITILGDRIVSISPRGTAARKGARVVDADGMWAIPGLWDAHVHLTKAGEEALPLLLGNGVTSVRDMGGDLTWLRSVEERIQAGDIPGPRIWMSGPMLETPKSLERIAAQSTREPYMRTRIPIPDVAAAQRVVDSLASLGVDFVKIREAVSGEVYAEIVRAARARGLEVAGHAPFSLDPVDGAALGMASFEHASYPYPLDTLPARRREILDAFVRSGVSMVPTLTAWHTQVMHPESLGILLADTSGERDPRRPLISEELAWEWSVDLEGMKPKTEQALAGWAGFFETTERDMLAMHEAGIPVLPGTDLANIALFPGWSLHDELEALVRDVGLSPLEAITAATRQAAALLGEDGDLGTLEAGKLADLVLLTADPLVDIRNTRRIHAVVKGGRYYGPEEIRAMLGGLTPAARGDIGLTPLP